MWHYVDGNGQAARVSDEEARRLCVGGAIGPSTLVWQEGMADWAPAGSLPAFASSFAGAKPPPPVPARVLPASSSSSFAPGSDNETTLQVLTHVLGLFTGFIGPLIVLLSSKNETTKQHARRALNWQISLILYLVASFVLVFVIIGIFTLMAVIVLDLIFCIMATVKSGNRELWTYPMTIPFVKD